MNRLVLLGDSIFDNVGYVAGGPTVTDHTRRSLGADWQVQLLAADGSMIRDVLEQLKGLPSGTTHLIVSMGGNNLLDQLGILTQSAGTVAETLGLLAQRVAVFETDYQQTLAALLKLNLPTILSTIYYPRYPDPIFQRIGVTALALFNDIIIREAIGAGLPLLDLRLVCTEDSDYANPIEPSATGGAKIGAAIARVINQYLFGSGRTQVFF